MKSMLELAASIAQGGAERNFRLGCVAKRTDGAVVCSTNARTQVPNISAHAEYRALKKSDKGCTLWVARVNKDSSWAMAKPCAKCQSIIKAKNVYKVYYTISPNEYGVWYPGKSDLLNYKVIKSANSALWVEGD